MPKVSPLQGNFNGGEISPLLHGRVDSDRYKSSLAVCLNYIPTIQGGLTRRPGTQYVAEVKNSAKKVRLEPFEFSTTQAYMLEFGDKYLRFYMNYGQIISGGTPYEIVTPYALSDIFDLRFTQSADVLYIVHPKYPPAKLSRTAHTSWNLNNIDFQDGPYLATNTDNITVVPSATSGSGVSLTVTTSISITGCANNGVGGIRVTAASHGWLSGQLVLISGVTGTTEANGSWKINVVDSNTFDLNGSSFANAYTGAGTAVPSIFAVTDVGRLFRYQEASVWGWAKITAFTSVTNVTVEIKSNFGGAGGGKNWRLGVWSETTGYPGAVVFHEDRLSFGAATNSPQRFDCSDSSNYENFAPTDVDGTVKDNHSLNFSLNANDVNLIKWMTSGEKGILSGSVGGEWLVRPSATTDALTPSNISAKKSTAWGSASVQARQVDKATLFVQRGGRKVRELMYFFDVDGFRATDLTELAEHITGDGITQMTHQKVPQSIVWCLREDGVLLGLTYERDIQNLRTAWHRHILGGRSDAAGSSVIVESIAVIPSPDGTHDDLWLVVQRYINGSVKRYVENLTKVFEDIDEQENAFFVDCGLSYDVPISMTGATKANPVVVNAPAHGLSNGDMLRISGVKGMTQINGNTYVVAGAALNTFQLHDSDANPVDGSSWNAYVSGGQIRKLVTHISGLSHLEGETVSILADGAVLPDQVVTAGAITLTVSANTVQIGYGYNSDAQMLRLEAGAADGTALGKTRRMHRVGMLLHRSLGLKVGMSFDGLNQITFRTSKDAMTRAPKLFSGILSENIDADYDFENQFCWRQDQPLPSTVLAVMPMMITQDRG